jgi:DNA modification methylase
MPQLYYNEDNLYRIYYGNNRDLTAKLPDKSIPLMFADPPYGVDHEYDGQFTDNWEYYVENTEWLLTEGIRVSKVMVVTPGGYTNVDYWREQLKLKGLNWFRFCWYKGAMPHRSKVGFAHWEEVLVIGEKIYAGIPDFIYANPEQDKEGHDCPKPEKLVMFFINAYTKENELVFDPFLGGGTTMVAAKMLNRKGLGCELSEKYCAIAANRVSREMAIPNVVVKQLIQEEMFNE